MKLGKKEVAPRSRGAREIKEVKAEKDAERNGEQKGETAREGKRKEKRGEAGRVAKRTREEKTTVRTNGHGTREE